MNHVSFALRIPISFPELDGQQEPVGKRFAMTANSFFSCNVGMGPFRWKWVTQALGTRLAYTWQIAQLAQLSSGDEIARLYIEML